MKQVYYFSHDFHARKDPKCIALIHDFGMSGYGLYWALIEMMYEQGGKIKKFPSLFPSLSHEFKVSEKSLTKQIEAMLHQYELLLQDDKYIWSSAVLSRLLLREAKRSKKSHAGKIGGISSGKSRRNKGSTKQNEAVLQDGEANEAKERKGKEIKGKENKEEMLFTLWTEIKKSFSNDYNWKEKFCRDKNLTLPRLETLQKEFISDIELKEDFKELKDLKNHFTNWFNLRSKNGAAADPVEEKLHSGRYPNITGKT